MAANRSRDAPIKGQVRRMPPYFIITYPRAFKATVTKVQNRSGIFFCPNQAQNGVLVFFIPKCYPLCSEKGGCIFVNRNRSEIGRFCLFCDVCQVFNKSFVLLNTALIIRNVFHQIGRLALQETAECFNIIPRYPLTVSQLLDRGFTQQLFFS